MKKFLLLLILISVFIGIPKTLSSQTAKKVLVEVVVNEHGSKEPIQGCLISIPALELWAVTDALGRFKFSGIKTGSYTIEATCLGYEPLNIQHSRRSKCGAMYLR